MLESLDISGMANVAISVTIGSIVATIIVWKLVSHFVRKALLGVLLDPKIQLATTNFIKEHIVQPFNKLDNNSEIKTLIKETTERSLEIYLNKLKEKNIIK